MRLEAGKVSGWFVWHCTECRAPKTVWVDDDSNTWGELTGVDRAAMRTIVTTRQARKIVIVAASHVVFIDPPGDAQDETLRELVLVGKRQ